MNHAQFWGGGGAAPYEIEQSLRFDGSAYLSRSLGTTSSSWTVSFWTKTAHNDNNDGYWFNTSQTAIYMDASSGAPSDRRWKIRDASSGSLIVSSAVIRDPSAWYHVVYKCDGSNRRLYVNNSLDAGFTYSGSTTLSGSSAIGAYYTGSGAQLEGYIAEFHLVDGSALDPDQFAELDDNGVWRPIRYTGSHGSQGFYLKFDPTATNGIGHDHSGNGNNFTPTGFDTTNTTAATYDVMSDTPTNNFCTINPLAYQYVYYGPNEPKNGNLEVVPRQTYSGNWTHGVGTFPLTLGKWYFEIENDGGTNAYCGLYRVSDNPSWPWNQESSTYQYVYYSGNGNKINTSSSSYGASWNSAGDIIGVAYDGDAGTLTFYKNGTSQGTAFTGLTGTYVPRAQAEDNSGAKLICNFGQRAFAYTPPTGFKPLNTANLPAPTVKNGSQYFNTVTYTGNGSNGHAITGVGFQPDLVWGKCRSVGTDHYWVDAVRGVTKVLRSNVTNAEYTQTDSLVSFDSDGFTLDDDNSGGPSGNFNISGRTYAAWNWKTGATQGFDIVTHTNTNDSTVISHSLGVAPEFIITKSTDTSNAQWRAWHTAGGTSQTLILSTSEAYVTSSERVTAVSSSNFTYNATVTPNGSNFIHYLFAGVEGYSKIGSYTGNGSSDGPFVYCGFRPAFLIYKNTVSGYWNIRDSARNPFNPNNNELYPNVPDTENTHSSTRYIDFLSNGFKVRSGSGPVNGSNNTIIYMAFAEFPTGGSGVSPATAR